MAELTYDASRPVREPDGPSNAGGGASKPSRDNKRLTTARCLTLYYIKGGNTKVPVENAAFQRETGKADQRPIKSPRIQQ